MIWGFFCQSSHSFVFTIGTCNSFPDSVVVDPSFTHLRQVGFIVQDCLNMQGLLHSLELLGTYRFYYIVQNCLNMQGLLHSVELPNMQGLLHSAEL